METVKQVGVQPASGTVVARVPNCVALKMRGAVVFDTEVSVRGGIVDIRAVGVVPANGGLRHAAGIDIHVHLLIGGDTIQFKARLCVHLDIQHPRHRVARLSDICRQTGADERVEIRSC